MTTLKELNERINKLQARLSTPSKWMLMRGAIGQGQLSSSAEIEKEEICDAIDQMAIANCLVI